MKQKQQLTLLVQATAAIVTGFAVYSVPAAQFAYGFGYVSEYTSNVFRRPQDAENEWINSVIGGIAYAENSETLTARVTSQLEHREYANETFADQDILTLDASALWTISPRRFTWTVEDAARQVTLDPTGPDTPANRAGANVFSTGPDLFFQLASLHTLSIAARYQNLYVGNRDIDNNAYSGAVRWLYQLSPRTNWSVNLEQQKVDFDDDTLNEDFTRDDLYLRMDTRSGRNRFVIDGGSSRVERERSGEVNGSLARLNWTRDITADSSYGMSLARGYQDAGLALLSSVSLSSAPLVPVAAGGVGTDVVTSDVYYSRYADVFYTRRSGYVDFRVRARTRELDFEETPQDRREGGGRLELTYFYSGATTLALFAGYLKVKYIDLARTDADSEFGIRVGYRLTRTINLGLEGRRLERGSTDASAEYEDNRVLMTLFYASSPIYAPMSQTPMSQR